MSAAAQAAWEVHYASDAYPDTAGNKGAFITGFEAAMAQVPKGAALDVLRAAVEAFEKVSSLDNAAMMAAAVRLVLTGPTEASPAALAPQQATIEVKPAAPEPPVFMPGRNVPVRVTAVAPFDSNPKVKIGDTFSDVYAVPSEHPNKTREENAQWIFLNEGDDRTISTWCRVEALEVTEPAPREETAPSIAVYMPTVGERVRVVAVAEHDDTPRSKVGQVGIVTVTLPEKEPWIYVVLEGQDLGTYCRVESAPCAGCATEESPCRNPSMCEVCCVCSRRLRDAVV